MIAVLPMYDRPEVRDANDILWAAVRDGLELRGIAAPERLNREMAPHEAWLRPDLVLGQTCGLPYATRLAGRVVLVATPDYGVEGCPPGHYCSALVVRADDPREQLSEFRGAVPAINETGSQSGYAALMTAAATCATPGAARGRFFAAPLLSGAHRKSAVAVARGAADIAALDAVTWRLIQRHDPDIAAGLRVLARTPPTPGLPLIAAAGSDADALADAVADAIAAIDAATCEALSLRGLVRFDPAEYAPLAAAVAAAEAVHILPAD